MIDTLWNEPAVTSIYELRSNIMDIAISTKYFCDNIHKIAKKDYIMSINENMRIYNQTKRIIHQRFITQKGKFFMCDVGVDER